MDSNPEQNKKTEPELSEDIKAWREFIKDHADMSGVKKTAELLDQPEAAKKAFLEFAKTNLTGAFCYHYLFKNESWFEEVLWPMVFQNPETAIRCAGEIKDEDLRERVIAKAEDLSTPKKITNMGAFLAEERRRIEQGITLLDKFLDEEKRRKEQGDESE